MTPLPVDGTAVFVDANIYYYHFLPTPGLSEWCSELLERAANGRLIAFTSVGAMADTIHKIMAVEATDRFGVNRAVAVNFLRHNPDRVRELTAAPAAAAELSKMGCIILNPEYETLVDATEVSRTFGLLT